VWEEGRRRLKEMKNVGGKGKKGENCIKTGLKALKLHLFEL